MVMQSQEAVYNLLDRIMPELSSQFDVEIDASKVNTVQEGKDVVRLVKSASKNPTASEAAAEARAEAKIVVQASSGAHCSESRQKVQKESKIQCLGSL